MDASHIAGLPLSLDAFQEHLQHVLEQPTPTGLFSGVVWVGRDGEPLFQAVRGLAEKDFSSPNTLDTRFNIASITKTFTAVALAQLVERGALAFEDFAAPYLAGTPLEGRLPGVTLHHLLTHTAGLGTYWNDLYRARRSELRSVSSYLELFAADPPLFPPGSEYAYGNAGYVALGAVIEAASGQDYYSYVADHIFRPAGMLHSAFDELDLPAAQRATGYTFMDWDGSLHPEFLRNNLYLYAVRGSPAGGAYTTAGDLARFDQALWGGQLVSSGMLHQLTSAKVETDHPLVRYGYGFHIVLDGSGRAVGHGGRFMGADAFYLRYVDLGFTVIVLANIDRPAARSILDTVASLLPDLKV